MDFFKNTNFITLIWIILAFLLVLVGVYRESLYRDNSKKQQNKLIESLKEPHIQSRSATVEAATSIGVLNPRHFLGLLLINDSI